jgi:hypothetical protein
MRKVVLRTHKRKKLPLAITVLIADQEAVKNCNLRILALYGSVSYPVEKG